MEDTMAAVKLVSLTKEYRNGENYIRAVDDVSFSIKEGEFIAVIGASGSGKSTLINLISGLEKPTHGCVYVHDVNLTQLSLEEQISFRRWHIGVIFQRYNLIPAMNVFENIVLPAKLLERTVDEKEVFRLAKTLGIEEKLFQMPDELSGGQQQRAAIARAVYTHPTILLGDELTGNLDSRTSASVMELWTGPRLTTIRSDVMASISCRTSSQSPPWVRTSGMSSMGRSAWPAGAWKAVVISSPSYGRQRKR